MIFCKRHHYEKRTTPRATGEGGKKECLGPNSLLSARSRSGQRRGDRTAGRGRRRGKSASRVARIRPAGHITSWHFCTDAHSFFSSAAMLWVGSVFTLAWDQAGDDGDERVAAQTCKAVGKAAKLRRLLQNFSPRGRAKYSLLPFFSRTMPSLASRPMRPACC